MGEGNPPLEGDELLLEFPATKLRKKKYSKKTLRGRARFAWSAYIYAYIKDRPKIDPNYAALL